MARLGKFGAAAATNIHAVFVPSVDSCQCKPGLYWSHIYAAISQSAGPKSLWVSGGVLFVGWVSTAAQLVASLIDAAFQQAAMGGALGPRGEVWFGSLFAADLQAGRRLPY